MEIRGKKAVIVGGASGMARATAEMLVREGARVAILDLPSSKGEEAAAAIGGGTRFHPCDVTDFAGTEAAIERAADDLGAVHFGVNTAGGGIAKRTLTKEGPHPLDDFRAVIDLNLIASFNVARLQADGHEPERARRERRARRDRDDRVDRRLRGPDRPGRLHARRRPASPA